MPPSRPVQGTRWVWSGVGWVGLPSGLVAWRAVFPTTPPPCNLRDDPCMLSRAGTVCTEPRRGCPPRVARAGTGIHCTLRPRRGRAHRFVVIGALLEFWGDFDPFSGRIRPIFPCRRPQTFGTPSVQAVSVIPSGLAGGLGWRFPAGGGVIGHTLTHDQAARQAHAPGVGVSPARWKFGGGALCPVVGWPNPWALPKVLGKISIFAPASEIRG